MKKDFKQELTELINKGDRIKYNGKPGKIEVIKAEYNGNFSYEVRFDKKDGTPSVRVTSIYPLLKTDKMEKRIKTPRNYNRGFGVYVYKTNRAKISPTQLFL